MLKQSREVRRRPAHFQRRSSVTAGAALGLRVLAALALVGIALAGHWFDREGLRDNTDGEVSFIDVVYFTMITVTTVGYGDIVPVTDRARLFDTFVVTPVRIFVWLIFLGTAYTFLFKNTWERWRMARIQRELQNHTIVCGYGATGAEAVAELLRRGCPPDGIVVVDADEIALEEADELGVGTVLGDATHNAVLQEAGIIRARALVVSPNRDDTAVLIAMTARRLAPEVPVAVGVRATENEILARDAGAAVIVNPVSFGGRLLAGATMGSHIADYVSDLVTSDGRVKLNERPVTPQEVGRPLRGVETGQALRLYRDGRTIGFWEPEAAAMEAGDVLIEIVPTTDQ
ncbi:potassium channel family protein [Sphingomonas sp. A2-49]|uniref:potassium channel family protein n=1 Tax=Sphingomonas sp. A2-49 TaxID=1391375 RepID=UPI0021D04575|nr:potassium channel family protein [Sphingomonas sp. A2-49]MCU6452988.1 potassium channel family protein [Sphingomonas sp. A2-49]